MVSKPSLPASVREVAILVTGAHFRSAYELYAHVIVAEKRGLPDDKLATIVAGQRPANLSPQEGVAYDVASALVGGGVLPELTYRAAVEQFGQHGAAELSYLVGLYCLVSVTLNTFDVPVPESAGSRAGETKARSSRRADHLTSTSGLCWRRARFALPTLRLLRNPERRSRAVVVDLFLLVVRNACSRVWNHEASSFETPARA